jgi:hypothetical protein
MCAWAAVILDGIYQFVALLNPHGGHFTASQTIHTHPVNTVINGFSSTSTMSEGRCFLNSASSGIVFTLTLLRFNSLAA